ncbi:GNAT family N-acetyltransferase [Allostreptomyces psammosilenae]|uniref:RimJ/RimL family protein N-acetyltransferase n=1 Tax=Allostreptomyces psammosilenae TaxID=1892865 RepID=A0A853A0L1_9ACTN|nr:GNAT family N-acetyltransferase [Allostreptomyces psammosilenae]NYI04052.1 RimJ/RimL family protein N-acetyltransferase [Allostreptomyces psammosilenae]
MTPSFPDVSLGTDRLVLRRFEAEDVPQLVDMMDDEAVVTWLRVPHPYTARHAEEWVRHGARRLREDGDGLALAVCEHLTGRLVGSITLQGTDWAVRSTDLTVVTAPWARGEGYAPEAVLAIARWLFEEHGFARVEMRTAAGNAAPQQVARKAGFISEGVLRSAGLVRLPDADSSSRTHEFRTDLILWGLLPEDLEDLELEEPDDEGAVGQGGYHDGPAASIASPHRFRA